VFGYENDGEIPRPYISADCGEIPRPYISANPGEIPRSCISRNPRLFSRARISIMLLADLDAFIAILWFRAAELPGMPDDPYSVGPK
jgi:hypothetical protein